MFKILTFIIMSISIISAKVVLEIKEEPNLCTVNLINNGLKDIPLAGYRLIAPDTTWDSITSDHEIYSSYYTDTLLSNYVYNDMEFHQINFKDAQNSIIVPGDTFSVSYHYSSSYSAPYSFNEYLSWRDFLCPVILRGYKDTLTKELYEFDSTDVTPPIVIFYMPTSYKMRSAFGGRGEDYSGISAFSGFKNIDWSDGINVESYVENDISMDFNAGFEHTVSEDEPGWIVAYDKFGNGSVVEIWADASPIESYTYNNKIQTTISSNGKINNINKFSSKSDLKLEMRNANGRLIYTKTIISGTPSIQIPLSSRCIGSGLYFVTLSGADYKETFKVNLNR